MVRRVRRWVTIAGVTLGLMAAAVEPALAGIGINHCEPPTDA